MAQSTYLSSLLQPEDAELLGIMIQNGAAIHTPDAVIAQIVLATQVILSDVLTFPDGTVQRTAGGALPSVIDTGVF